MKPCDFFIDILEQINILSSIYKRNTPDHAYYICENKTGMIGEIVDKKKLESE